MSPTELPRGISARQAKRRVFIALFCSYAYFYQGSDHNSAARFDLTRALIEDHSVRVDRFRYNSGDLVEVRGATYSTKAPGMSLIGVPAFAIASRVLQADKRHVWDLVAWITTVVSVGLLSALAGARVFSALAERYDRSTALTATGAVWHGSIVFPFSTLFFGHATTAALLVLSFLDALGRKGEARPLRAGLLAGCAIAIEYPAAIVAVLLGFAIARTNRAHAAAFALGVIPGALVVLSYHFVAFGDPFLTPYGALAATSVKGFGATHAQGLSGVAWRGPEKFLNVLYAITLDPQRGLFYANPILLLAIPGFFLLWKRRDETPAAALIPAIFVAMLLFNACYGDSIVYWGGGASVGPRHMIPALPFLAWPLAEAAQRWRRLFFVVCSVSFVAMFATTMVDPRFPYDFKNPIIDFALRFFSEGQIAQNRSVLFQDAEGHGFDLAWNVSTRMGVPAPLSALPLLIVIAALVAPVLSRPGRVTVSAFLLALALSPLALIARDPGTGPWYARYYRGTGADSEVVSTRCSETIDFDWSTRPPLVAPFHVIFEAKTKAGSQGLASLRLDVDDDAELHVDGRRVHESKNGRAGTAVTLDLGVEHLLQVRYENPIGGGWLRLFWKREGRREEIVPATAFQDWGCGGRETENGPKQ